MKQLNTYNLVANVPVALNTYEESGVLEFVNSSILDVVLAGGFGQVRLPAQCAVGLENTQYGQTIIITPVANLNMQNPASTTLAVNWYAPGERDPYPVTSIPNVSMGGNAVQIQSGLQIVSAFNADNQIIVIVPQPSNLTIYLKAFTITMDKAATPSSGSMSIDNLKQPSLSNVLYYWLIQSQQQVFIAEVFDSPIPAIGPNTAVHFNMPNLTASIGLNIYYYVQ